jgi:hypothetical protein
MKFLVVPCAIDNYPTDASLHGLNLYYTEGFIDNPECKIPYGSLNDIEADHLKKIRVVNHVDFERQQWIGSRLRQKNDNAEVQRTMICPQLPV